MIDHPQTKEGRYAGGRYKAVYCLRKSGTVHTAAGYFENCLTLEIEVIGLTEGYVAYAEYTCERNDITGQLTLFTDLCGIRELPTKSHA